MKWTRILAILAGLGVGAWSCPTRAAPADDGGAFVEEFIRGSMNLRADPQLSAEQRNERSRHFLDEHYDMRGTMPTILGQYWTKASTEAQARCITVFEDYLVASYGSRFDQIAAHLAFRDTAADGGRTVVHTVDADATSDPTTVDWVLVKTAAQGWLIGDVKMNGVSLTQVIREEVKAILRANSGDIEGLLAAIQRQTAALRNAT